MIQPPTQEGRYRVRIYEDDQWGKCFTYFSPTDPKAVGLSDCRWAPTFSFLEAVAVAAKVSAIIGQPTQPEAV